MKQPQYQPLPLEKEVVIIFAATSGYLDDVPRDRVADFERDLYRYMDSIGKNVATQIAKGTWSADIEKSVRAMLDEFKKAHPYGEEKREPVAQQTAQDPKKEQSNQPAERARVGA